MIGNAHIDPVWLWQWPEGYQEVRATFRSAIDRMKEYPDFIFTCDSAALLRVGRGERPGALRADPRARRRGTLPDHRRLVGRARLQHPERRVVRAPGALRPALPAREVRHHRDDRREHRLLRAQRDDPADPRARAASTRTSSCGRGRRRSDARHAALLVGVRRRLARARRTASRTSTARRRTTSASTSTRRSRRCRRARTSYAVFYGVGNHGGGPTIANLEQHPAPQRARRPAARSSSARRAASSTDVDANGEIPTSPRRAAAPLPRLLHDALRHQALEPPRGEPAHARREVVRDRRLARRAHYPLDDFDDAPGSSCCSTSSTTRSRARRSSPHTRTRATSSATRRRSPRTRSTRPCSRSRAASASSRRRRRARSSSSTRTRGRCGRCRRSSTPGCATRARTSSTTRGGGAGAAARGR